MKIVNYDIVESDSRTDLRHLVNKHIALGWVPIGGLVVDAGSWRRSYMQAMGKEEDAAPGPQDEAQRRLAANPNLGTSNLDSSYLRYNLQSNLE